MGPWDRPSCMLLKVKRYWKKGTFVTFICCSMRWVLCRARAGYQCMWSVSFNKSCVSICSNGEPTSYNINFVDTIRCVSWTGQLAVLGSDERYKPCKIKVFTYPEKRLTREFDELDKDMKPRVSTPLICFLSFNLIHDWGSRVSGNKVSGKGGGESVRWEAGFPRIGQYLRKGLKKSRPRGKRGKVRKRNGIQEIQTTLVGITFHSS